MRLISTIIIAILPFTLGQPLHDLKPGDIQLKGIIQHDGEASSDAAAAINADRLIAVRSGSQTSPPNLEPVSNEDSLDTVGETLQTITSLSALGDRLASKIKRGLISAATGGLLSGDDPLGSFLNPVEGLLGFLGLDSLLGGSGGGLSGETPAAAPSEAALSGADPSEDCTEA